MEVLIHRGEDQLLGHLKFELGRVFEFLLLVMEIPLDKQVSVRRLMDGRYIAPIVGYE